MIFYENPTIQSIPWIVSIISGCLIFIVAMMDISIENTLAISQNMA